VAADPTGPSRREPDDPELPGSQEDPELPGSQEEPDDSRQELGRAARPYSIVVGILFLAAITYAGINALENRAPGLGGLEAGEPLPRFAAPSATGRLDGDANINQDNRDRDGDPQTPACDVPGPRSDVVRICDYFDRPLVMVAWFTRGCGTCRRQLDTVERVRGRFPAVAFIGLDIADSKSNARSEVLENGWRFPMALDRDGAVGGLYRVGGGPTTFFAYPGGISMGTKFGDLDQRELEARVRRLLRSSRRRGLLR
jgi:AhpC/TSA family protein